MYVVLFSFVRNSTGNVFRDNDEFRLFGFQIPSLARKHTRYGTDISLDSSNVFGTMSDCINILFQYTEYTESTLET